MCFKIGRIGLCALHGTKCPLLMGVFFSFGQPQPQHQLGLRKHLILPSFVVFCCFSNHRTIASRLHRKLKFGTQAHFNPTRGNIKKQIGVTCPPPRIGLSLKLALLLPGNPGSWNSVCKLISTQIEEKINRNNWVTSPLPPK